MIQARTELQPANWQTTIIVEKDWTTKCVWYNRYKQKAPDDKKQQIDKAVRLKTGKCTGPNCPLVTEYRDKLVQEEFS